MIQLHWLDSLVILTYLVALFTVGLIKSSKNNTEQNYILAGRRLSLPGFVMTLVATWYGGILGVGENTYLYGLQTWVIFGLPYYLFAILFAIYIAPRIRKANLLSIPDHFHRKYGKTPSILSAVFILFLSSPAPYVLSVGILIQALTGLSYPVCLSVALIASLIYIWKGGFGAVVRTDILQFILMIAGFIFLIGFAWTAVGSPLAVWNQLPDVHRSPSGGNSSSYILVWFFIALWTFIDPGFYQRSAAAESGRIARKGIILSVIIWFIFDMLTLFSGFYARVILPDTQPLMAFPALGAEVLPPFFLGLFITGLLATIMSTIDSLGLINAVTFGRDILWRLRDSIPGLSRLDSIDLTRLGLLVMAIISLILAWTIPSVIGLWYVIGSIVIPGLILPFILSFSSWQVTEKKSIILMGFPVIIPVLWWGLSYWVGPPFSSIEPFFPGIITSLLLLGLFLTPKYR